MIPPKIAPLPPAPVRADAPDEFSAKSDAMVGALQPFANQANVLAEFVNTRADNADASAASLAGVQSAVSADRVLSQQAASNAAGSAAAASSSASTANSRATAAQSSANASEASAVRAEDAAQYVEGITGGAAPLNNPNFTGVVKVNDVPLGTAATVDTGNEVGQINLVGDVASYCLDIDDATQRGRWYVNGDTVGTKPTALGIVDTYGYTGDSINQDYVELVGAATTAVMRRFFRSKIVGNDWSSWSEYIDSSNSVNDTMTITRNGNQVTKITEDGADTDITYNPDGTVNTVTYQNGTKIRTETYTYSAGQVTGMTASEV